MGDHNQLPPVGPGNVLRDLIHEHPIPVTVLNLVVRQAGELKENCSALLKGEVRPTSAPRGSKPREWYLANNLKDADAVFRTILDAFNSKLQRLGFDLLRDVQVLTPTHKGPLGTVALNAALQQLVQRKLFGVDAKPNKYGPRFYPHDKVIQTRNDYQLGVMNGAVGFVKSVSSSGDLTIDFDGEDVEFEAGSDSIKRLKLAYVITTHKSQGSEFPCVIAIIHKSHSFMLHRNIFYTAASRAQKTAIILGDRWGISNCAKKNLTDKRRTFMGLGEQWTNRSANGK